MIENDEFCQAGIQAWYNIITLQFEGGEAEGGGGEGHASRPPQCQNISIIPLYFFFWGELCTQPFIHGYLYIYYQMYRAM